QETTHPGELPGSAFPGSGSYLDYAGASSLNIRDAMGQSSTVDRSGQPSGGIPGIIPIVPDDATNLPSTGLLYIPETSAYTITESPTTTGTASLELMGANGAVTLAETGDTAGQPLTAIVSSSAR